MPHKCCSCVAPLGREATRLEADREYNAELVAERDKDLAAERKAIAEAVESLDVTRIGGLGRLDAKRRLVARIRSGGFTRHEKGGSNV